MFGDSENDSEIDRRAKSEGKKKKFRFSLRVFKVETKVVGFVIGSNEIRRSIGKRSLRTENETICPPLNSVKHKFLLEFEISSGNIRNDDSR